MLGLKGKINGKDAPDRQSPAGSPKWALKAVGDTFKCAEAGTTGAQQSGWHFGCREISVPAGIGMKSAPMTIKSTDSKAGDGIYRPPAGANIRTLKAEDFWINYADAVMFTAATTKYDPASCVTPAGGTDGKHKDLNAQDSYLVPDDPRSYWAQQKIDFKDPFFRFQRLDGGPAGPCDMNDDGEVDITDIRAIFDARNTRTSRGGPGDADYNGIVTVNDARRCTSKVTKEYSLYDDAPCVPAAFPMTVPELPSCTLRNSPAPPLVMDVNLSEVETMFAPIGTSFPAFLTVETEGDGTGIRVVVDPPPGAEFEIPGGVSNVFGDLTICSSTNVTQCQAPDDLAEGRELEVTINVFYADGPEAGELWFFQRGQFVRDSEPPRVISHSVTVEASDMLRVTVEAVDAATSPIHADFWFSTDGGTNWDHAALAASTDVLEQPSSQSFEALVTVAPAVQPTLYFIAVQDTVFNTTFYGIGTAAP